MKKIGAITIAPEIVLKIGFYRNQYSCQTLDD